MAYTIIDPETFSSRAVSSDAVFSDAVFSDAVSSDAVSSDSIFSESEFLENAGGHDWEQYRDKSILVRGCSSRVVPPWAFMYLTGKLVGRAKVIRFGNEHDNIVVYRVASEKRPTSRDRQSS